MSSVFFNDQGFQQYMLLYDCPYCHVSNHTVISDSPNVVRCNICGLYRLYPRMTRQGQIAMLKKYNDENASFAIPGELPSARYKPFPPDIRLRWEVRKLKQVFPSVFPNGRVLDVGTDRGYFLAALEEAGAIATGIEPIEKLVESGRQHKLDVRCGRFEPSGMPPDIEKSSFDLICFRGAILFTPDWRETFDLIKTLLRPGGGIYLKEHIATSSYYQNHSYTSRYSYYVSGMPTKESLLYILKREGFTIRKTSHYLLAIDYYQRLQAKAAISPTYVSIATPTAKTSAVNPFIAVKRAMLQLALSIARVGLRLGGYAVLMGASITVSWFMNLRRTGHDHAVIFGVNGKKR